MVFFSDQSYYLLLNIGRLNMNGTVVDDRKRIHTELRHFAHTLKFGLN